MQIGQTGVFQAAATSIKDKAEAPASKGSRMAEVAVHILPQDTTSFSAASTSASGIATAVATTATALVQQSMAAAPARAARVQALRQSVADGSYALDAGSIADAMIRNTQ